MLGIEEGEKLEYISDKRLENSLKIYIINFLKFLEGVHDTEMLIYLTRCCRGMCELVIPMGTLFKKFLLKMIDLWSNNTETVVKLNSFMVIL